MKHLLMSAFASILLASVAGAATTVELVDCRMTPEVKNELKLTADQGPKVEKAFADVASMSNEAVSNRKKRDELRAAKADPATMEPFQKKLVEMEDKCTARLHELLKPILTDAQFKIVETMEGNHHHQVGGNKDSKEQQGGHGQPSSY